MKPSHAVSRADASGRAHSAAQSYAHGGCNVPLLGETIADNFDRIVATYPERLAVVACHQHQRLTYRELEDATTRLASGLASFGVSAGDRVAMWAANGIESLIALEAVARLNATFVGINPAFRAHELQCALADARVTTLITARRFLNNDCVGVLLDLMPELKTAAPGSLHAERLPDLRTVIYLGQEVGPGGVAWTELLTETTSSVDTGRPPACQSVRRPEPDDAALIFFTSGTGGRQKGVSLSHHAVVNGGFFVGLQLQYGEAERVCVPLPLIHVLGGVAGALGALSHGASLVLPGAVFEATKCLEAIHQERCSIVFGVPSMFTAMLEHPARASFDLTCLRAGVVSGAVCPPSVMRRIITELHVPEVTVGYGLTEVSPILYSAVDDDVERRARITGRVQPHMQCKIIDADSGSVVPRGTRGELCAKGYGVMQGYIADYGPSGVWLDRGDWIHTGDLAVMEANDDVRIIGRVKDLIIRGGQNISPSEIEEVLARHPGIAEVHVVGVPDQRYGEEICACIRERDGEIVSEQEVRRFCRTHLASYMIPRHVCFPREFPRTSTGKVQKFALRDTAADLLGLVSTGPASTTASASRATTA